MPQLSITSQEIFAQNVARGKSLTDAQLIAGYEQNSGNAHTLSHQPAVLLRINELKGIIAARAQVSGERVLAEMARIAFANISDAVRIVDGKVQALDTDRLSPDIQAAIAEISEGRDGIKVKLHDKRAALENLGKHLGLFKENIDLNVNVSLSDLVNGSYSLEHGEVKPAAPAQIEHLIDDKTGE